MKQKNTQNRYYKFFSLASNAMLHNEKLKKMILNLKINSLFFPVAYYNTNVFKKMFDNTVNNFDSIALKFYENKPLQAGVVSFSFAFALATVSIHYLNNATQNQPSNNQTQYSNYSNEMIVEKFLTNGRNSLKDLSFANKEEFLAFINSFETEQDINVITRFPTKIKAFTLLLETTEGKENKFYKDNRGIAIGYGWNPTQNTKEFNLKIAKALKLNKKETANIIKISNTNSINAVPDFLKDFYLNNQQLSKIAEFTMERYEKEFLNVLKVKAEQKSQNYDLMKAKYSQLPFNQQVVFIHMVYKVGATNLLKYDDFFDNIFAYFNNPTIKNLDVASNSFQYSYVDRNGTRRRDTRIEKTHQNFFVEHTILNEDNKRTTKIAIR